MLSVEGHELKDTGARTTPESHHIYLLVWALRIQRGEVVWDWLSVAA